MNDARPELVPELVPGEVLAVRDLGLRYAYGWGVARRTEGAGILRFL